MSSRKQEKSEARISLVTKDGERFEGVLHLVNEGSNTVTLKNVRSFGTEGRKGKKGPIPPSHDIMEIAKFDGVNLEQVNVLNADIMPKGNFARSRGNAAEPTVSRFKKPDGNVSPVQIRNSTLKKVADEGTHASFNQRAPISSKIPKGETSKVSYAKALKEKPERATAGPRILQNKSFQQKHYSKKPTNLDDEFDFLEHNKKYEKLQDKMHNLNVYDKKVSFFDNFSGNVNSVERSRAPNARNSRNSAQKLDVETFGVEMLAAHKARIYRRGKHYKK